MSEELKILFYLLIFGLPLLANLLEKARKKQLKGQNRPRRRVQGQARKPSAPRGTTGQRPTLAEWIEELRRQSGQASDVAPAPPSPPLHGDLLAEEDVVRAEPAQETKPPAPPPLTSSETEHDVEPEEAPLADAAQLIDSEDLAGAALLSSAGTTLVSPSSKKRGLVVNRSEIQRAIVMREVLGPPRALAIMGRKGWSEKI
ncbi:MAG TPA: hypothetical protein ENK43_02135 [Planctomycetes bacterium]|nr:hypothetical protein [Planctomycetota bacterium]